MANYKKMSPERKRKYNEYQYKRQKEQRKKRKQMFVEEAGGGCKRCGYDKCLGALQFHHRDPDEKKFNLSCRELGNFSLEKLREEFAKCDLLCANCHAEEHWS